MPALAKHNDQRLETVLRSVPTPSSYTQPWWQSIGNNAMSSSAEQEDASLTSATLQSQGNDEGFVKETENGSSFQSGTIVLYLSFLRKNSKSSPRSKPSLKI